jgi:hypothetical protein
MSNIKLTVFQQNSDFSCSYVNLPALAIRDITSVKPVKNDPIFLLAILEKAYSFSVICRTFSSNPGTNSY